MRAEELSFDSLLALRDAPAEQRQGRFLVEGVRFLAAAADAGAQIEALVSVRTQLVSPVARMILRRLARGGVPHLSVGEHDFARLSRLEEPQHVAAVVRERWCPLARLRAPARNALWVAVEEVRSPGNLGSLLRTCDAVGATGLLCGPQVDPHQSGVVRATMGSLFHLDMVRADVAALRALDRGGEYVIVGTAPAGARDFRAISYRRPVVLAIGCERRGLSPRQRAACDVMVRIPMAGRCDSLNLGVAASVLLYEVYGQRHPARRASRP